MGEQVHGQLLHLGTTEVVAHQREQAAVPATDRVVGGQIHAPRPHGGLAFQSLEIGLQGEFRTPEDHVVDLVILQVAQGGGVTLAAGEEVFVDARSIFSSKDEPGGGREATPPLGSFLF